MFDAKQIDNRKLILSLGSALCPACGGKKNRSNTFCSRCYYKLPREMRSALYGLVATGRYQPAVIDAMNALNAEEFRMPANVC